MVEVESLGERLQRDLDKFASAAVCLVGERTSQRHPGSGSAGDLNPTSGNTLSTAVSVAAHLLRFNSTQPGWFAEEQRMRPNFGWQRALTRCFAISTVMACATSMAWGQLGNPNPTKPNPSSAGNDSSNPTSVDGQQPQTTESSVASPQEATGIGAVLGTL